MFGNSVKTITKDAFELKRGELEGFDAIIDAFATSPDQASIYMSTLAARLIHLSVERKLDCSSF